MNWSSVHRVQNQATCIGFIVGVIIYFFAMIDNLFNFVRSNGPAKHLGKSVITILKR